MVNIVSRNSDKALIELKEKHNNHIGHYRKFAEGRCYERNHRGTIKGCKRTESGDTTHTRGRGYPAECSDRGGYRGGSGIGTPVGSTKIPRSFFR